MEKIKIYTSLGDIVVRLYDETPIHRDNFVKLATEGYYNGTLFHRVIKDFMVQGGDPDSVEAPADKMLGTGGPDYTLEAEIKGYYNGTLFHRVIKDFMVQGGDPDSVEAPADKMLGTGGPDYTLEAEIKPGLFHKRGALAAARQADEVNPERRSSGSQFYIVWGQTFNAGQLKQLGRQLEMKRGALAAARQADEVNPERRSSGSQFYIVWGQTFNAGQLKQLGRQLEMQALQQTFNTLVAAHRDEIMQLRRERNRAALQELQDKLEAEARQQVKEAAPSLSPEQSEVYASVGGTPHLDGQYTVFGEVEEGLDIVEKIQQTPTRRGDRPVTDVVVLRMERI